MMLRLGVTPVALALLFGLTAPALWTAGLLGHPRRVAAVLAAGTVALGVVLLLE